MSLTAEQLAERRTMLTATDMVVLSGVSPYGRTPHDVYLSKLGLDEPSEQTAAMAMGHRLEPVALAALAEARGLTIRPGHTERHPVISWLGATPDGDVLQQDSLRIAVAEAKAVGLRMAHRWGEDGDPEAIPDDVRVQVQTQMTVARVRRAYVAAIIATEFRTYEVEHDDDLAGALLEMGEAFWNKHVLARRPPDVDGSEGSARMIRGLFRRSTAGLIDAPAEAEPLVRAYLAARDAADEAEKAKRAAQAKLCALIGEAEGIRSAEWIATWKAREGSPRWKEIAEKLGATPELAEQYRGEPIRVLNVKPMKGRAA